MKIDNKGEIVPNKHNLLELSTILGENISNEITNCLPILMPDGEGDNFKYLVDKEGQSFYHNDRLDALSSISSFIADESIKQTAIFPIKLDTKDKKLISEWTFYTGEVSSLGHIKSQYDALISALLSALQKKELNISETYLPLHFLIRHSLELAFKDNSLEVFKVLTQNKQKDCVQEHSLVKLFNIIGPFIKEVSDKLPEMDEIKKQIEKYLPMTEKLCETFHKLDSRSLSFRFPVDQKGNCINIPFEKNMLFESINAYQVADAFISLSITLLKYEGYLMDDYPQIYDEYFIENYGHP